LRPKETFISIVLPDGAGGDRLSDKTARSDAEKTTVALTAMTARCSSKFSPDGQQVGRHRMMEQRGSGVSAKWREGKPRVSRKKLVTYAEFSSDGTRIITASWDQTARLWNGLTGEIIATLRGHQDGVSRAAFTPDGKLIVTTSADSTARLWDGITGRAVAVLKGHKGQVHDAQFSPDGRWLVTAADDGTARLWEVATHETIDIFGGHAGRVVRAFLAGRAARSHRFGGQTARIWEVAPTTSWLTRRS
jgi:WD40 repeat protein